MHSCYFEGFKDVFCHIYRYSRFKMCEITFSANPFHKLKGVGYCVKRHYVRVGGSRRWWSSVCLLMMYVVGLYRMQQEISVVNYKDSFTVIFSTSIQTFKPNLALAFHCFLLLFTFSVGANILERPHSCKILQKDNHYSLQVGINFLLCHKTLS